MSRLWFMPATPVLSNGGANRGPPISCFLNSVPDSLNGIVDTWNENAWLAVMGRAMRRPMRVQQRERSPATFGGLRSAFPALSKCVG